MAGPDHGYTNELTCRIDTLCSALVRLFLQYLTAFGYLRTVFAICFLYRLQLLRHLMCRTFMSLVNEMNYVELPA